MLEKITKSPALLAVAFLVSGLLGAGVFAAVQAMVPGANLDRARVESIVHAYILDHGELLPEAMERLDTRQRAERDKKAVDVIAANKRAITEPYAGAVQGNPRGDVTVAAYLDYNCGYCRASLPAIAELVQRDPNVRVVYREFPVLSEQSVVAARWALAAAEQGKFVPFHKAVYAAGRTDDASLAGAAQTAGLDPAAVRKAAEAPAIKREIETNLDIATKLGSGGATPFWVVGDKVIAGLVDYDRLSQAVAEARKAK